MPRPVSFTCRGTASLSPESIADRILDLEQWPSFTGHGPLPGIRSAAFRDRTDDVAGSVIAVVNTDGSTHTETIVEWDPPRRLVLRLGEFSRPLRWFADHFTEAWGFETGCGSTRITRDFELVARGWWGIPMLWLVRALLRGAIRKQLRELAQRG